MLSKRADLETPTLGQIPRHGILCVAEKGDVVVK